MLRMYAAIYRGMRDSLQLGKEHSEEFREQKRRQKIPFEQQPRNESANIRKDPTVTSQGAVPTRNFFASLTPTEMDVERTPVEEMANGPNQNSQQPSSSKRGRPPPIVLNSTTNLMLLQRHIKGLSSATPGARPELS
jgi:hypothetical protein